MKKIAIISSLCTLWIFALIFTQFTIPGIFSLLMILELLPENGYLALLSFVALCLTVASILFWYRRLGLGVAVILFGCFLFLNVALWSMRDNARIARMEELQMALESLQNSGTLPENLNNTSFHALLAGPFGIDAISYRKSDENYIIESYAVPLGPFTLYSSERTEWYFEE